MFNIAVALAAAAFLLAHAAHQVGDPYEGWKLEMAARALGWAAFAALMTSPWL